MRTHHLGPRAFARAARHYLQYYRALGLRYRGVEHVLSRLGRYLTDHSATDIDRALYDSWRASRASLHPNSRRHAEQIVHRFCQFRRRSEPTAFMPGPDEITRLRPYVRPVIVEPEQIGHMLAAAARLRPGNNSPLRAAVARMAIVLLYTAGLRSGEIRRLQVEDVEEAGAVLRIRESKFHKSRLVALSTSTQVEVQRYLRQRATFATWSPDRGPFLCNRSRGGVCPYSAPGFEGLIHRLFGLAGVTDHEGRTPRVHDMRHSFAVQSLIQAYRTQGDPQALLPKLALYMGHVSVESTIHYLRLVPLIAALASARFESAYGQQVLGEQP
jgi:integrase/recombinase XerD